MTMLAVPPSFYISRRIESGAVTVLADAGDCPPEKVVQKIWLHQRVLREKLVTLEGQRVRILHPGFPSRSGGPDFQGAVIQFEGEAPVSGDVEVDLHTSGWKSHGHDRNPAFKNVVLHVVWQGDKQGARPTLVVNGALDSPIGELCMWMDADTGSNLPEPVCGKCAPGLSLLSAAQLTALLEQAALARLRTKASLLEARARQAGWEQSLWEGVFRALGYRGNSWPMHCIAELRARWWPAPGEDPRTTEARLLGISGLLPGDLTREAQSSDRHIRAAWDAWWRERERFSDCLLPRQAWKLGGLRPANHPVRRLALAARWASSSANGQMSGADSSSRKHAGSCDSADRGLMAAVEQWGSEELDENPASTLHTRLQVSADDFWNWHWSWRGPRLPRPHLLLGRGRVTDLAINVLLPWLWTRACAGGSEAMRARVERCYFSWPAAEDNSVLRLCRARLLPGRKLRWSAATQQGLVQWARDFCDSCPSTCEGCRFPGVVDAWRSGREG